MSDANRCPSCGSDRSGNRPEGLCPRCLLQQALDSDLPIDGTGAWSGVELTVSLEPWSTSVLARVAGSIGGVPHVLLRDTEATAGPGRSGVGSHRTGPIPRHPGPAGGDGGLSAGGLPDHPSRVRACR